MVLVGGVHRVPAGDVLVENVDVVVERLGLGKGRALGEGHRFVDPRERLRIELGELGLVEHALCDELLAEGGDRVARLPALDLLA